MQGRGRASGGLCEEDSHWAGLTWLLNDDICHGYTGPVSATPGHSLQCLRDFFSFVKRKMPCLMYGFPYLIDVP